MELLHESITSRILKGYYNVYNTLGYGFLEKVYENSLLIELRSMGLRCERQKPIDVFYRQNAVGLYYADIAVESCVIVEIKAMEGLVEEHEYQLINYLKATRIEVGLLVNFGKVPQFKRKVFQNISA